MNPRSKGRGLLIPATDADVVSDDADELRVRTAAAPFPPSKQASVAVEWRRRRRRHAASHRGSARCPLPLPPPFIPSSPSALSLPFLPRQTVSQHSHLPLPNTNDAVQKGREGEKRRGRLTTHKMVQRRQKEGMMIIKAEDFWRACNKTIRGRRTSEDRD